MAEEDFLWEEEKENSKVLSPEPRRLSGRDVVVVIIVVVVNIFTLTFDLLLRHK